MNKQTKQSSLWEQIWLAVRDSAEIKFVAPNPALVPVPVLVQEPLPPVRIYESEMDHLWIDRR